MPALYNLREYHRPTDLDEAIYLLRRTDVRTAVLAGGTTLVGEGTSEIEAVVDLDGLGLDLIRRESSSLSLGAMLRLQTIVEKLGDVAGGLLVETARRMAGANIRNAATLGGVLAGGDIHAPLCVALAALHARVEAHGQAVETPLWSDLAGDIRRNGLKGRLLTAVVLELPDGETGAGYEQVARTPADHPIVCAVAVASRSNDGTIEAHIGVGGLLRDDLVVITRCFAERDAAAAIKAVSEEIVPEQTEGMTYMSDFLGGAEYRRSVAPVLSRRVLATALNQIGITAGDG